jgi:transcriptional regulator with XRE-family HTH domain
MPDVPNLSILTPKKEKPMEEIAPQNRLGHAIRSRRNVLRRSLNEATADIAKALGNPGFTNVVLGEIERGVRPATMDELQAIARVLDISLEELKQRAIEWHEAIWDGKPRYELRPGETDAATIHVLSHTEAMDELRGAIADMLRGVDDLRRAEDHLRGQREFDLASDMRHTADLMAASVNRIATKMGRRWAKAQPGCAQGDEPGA